MTEAVSYQSHLETSCSKNIVVHLLCLLKKSALCADLIQTSFCSTEVSTVLSVSFCRSMHTFSKVN